MEVSFPRRRWTCYQKFTIRGWGRGPRIFVPNKSGTIIPNNMMPQADSSSGGSAMGGDVTVNFNINTVDAAGMDELLVDRRTTIVGIINQALNQRGRVGVTNG